MSRQEVDLVSVAQGIIFKKLEATIPGDGVLEIELTEADTGSVIELPHLGTLKGIRLLSNGDPSFFDGGEEYMIVLKSAGFSILNHEDLSVVEPTERLSTSSGETVYVDDRRIQIFYAYDGISWRWRIPDWSSYAGSIKYVPGDGTDWVDADPSDLQMAVDRLVAEVAILKGSPIS